MWSLCWSVEAVVTARKILGVYSLNEKCCIFLAKLCLFASRKNTASSLVTGKSYRRRKPDNIGRRISCCHWKGKEGNRFSLVIRVGLDVSCKRGRKVVRTEKRKSQDKEGFPGNISKVLDMK